jgi:ABC-2 type transport system permease protein
MTPIQQIRLVAGRELRERSRSRAFLASLAIMIVLVVATIAGPAILDGGHNTKRVGLAGEFSADLPSTIKAQSDAADVDIELRRYESIETGQDAVRDGDIHVLVVNGSRLEWQRQIDDQVRAVTSSAIQSLAIRDRASAAGIDSAMLRGLIRPVRITDVKLGEVAARTPDDETAALVMMGLLFFALSTYGTMVLSGVVEEKSSRVVEVLLARMPARNLLAGKIAGIGLLGFAQFALTALAALIAVSFVESFDIPAVRGTVLAWLVVWFLLGYAFYATVFGALGSLASRTEDTQTVAGPITVVMITAFFASFATVGSPDTTWAQVVSFLPPTAPLAMSARMAMSEPSWWEPVVAALVTLCAIVALVRFGGRVYTNAILHSGPTLKLRDVWRGSARHVGHPEFAGKETQEDPSAGGKTMALEETNRVTMTVLILLAVAVGVAVAVALNDVIFGVAAGAALFAVATRIIKIWSGNGRQASHR